MWECCSLLGPLMGDTCPGSSFLECLTPFHAETQGCVGCPHRSIPALCSTSQISLLLCICLGGRESGRGRLEELCSQTFSFPRPPTALLCFCKVITFLAQAGLRGMEPLMPRRKKVTLGVAYGAIPRQTVCPEAPVLSFPFPFESVEA